MNIDPTKYIFNCTIEDFVEVMKSYFPILANEQPVGAHDADGPTFSGRLVYGVQGICEFLHISRKTYYNWLPWLSAAIRQRGRKPIMDADYAIKLCQIKDKREDED